MDHLVIDPEICSGKPHLRGTRLTAELLQNLLAMGWSRDNILETYPYLTAEAVDAALSCKPAACSRGTGFRRAKPR